MNAKQISRSAFPVLIIAAFLINALVPGFGWMFWVVAAAIVLSGVLPAHRAVRKRRGVSDTAGVRHVSSPVASESKRTEEIGKSIGLGG